MYRSCTVKEAFIISKITMFRYIFYKTWPIRNDVIPVADEQIKIGNIDAYLLFIPFLL